jgi:hypothetical protein
MQRVGWMDGWMDGWTHMTKPISTFHKNVNIIKNELRSLCKVFDIFV